MESTELAMLLEGIDLIVPRRLDRGSTNQLDSAHARMNPNSLGTMAIAA